jgi:hypothetical protein
MAGIKDLMEAVDRDPYFERTPIPRERHPWMPSVKYSNQELAELIRSDPRFSGTNVGVNPAAYLDPRYESGLTRYFLGLDKKHGATGEYYRKDDPRREKGGRLWASTISDDPASFLNTLVHENIHANTFEGPAKEAAAQKRGDNPPFLARHLTAAARENLPPFGTNIGYENYEPVAWVGAAEAMLPEGQMPIQEDMNRQGLGALYAHMTTPGPVATRWDPSVWEALKAYIGPDEDTLQHTGPSVMQRVHNYVESELTPEEPYELKGNPKKGKKAGGSIAAIVAHNQRLRVRRRR